MVRHHFFFAVDLRLRPVLFRASGVLPSTPQKVYPTDHQEGEFLGHWFHSLAAAAAEPFLTTRAKALIPMASLLDYEVSRILRAKVRKS